MPGWAGDVRAIQFMSAAKRVEVRVASFLPVYGCPI